MPIQASNLISDSHTANRTSHSTMTDGKDAPLIEGLNVRFYDPDSMLNIPTSIINGYIVLLSGGAPTETAGKSEDEDSTTLGFLALTEGNVIESCYGIRSIKGRSHAAVQEVEKVKSFLAAAADTNDRVRSVAVHSYRTGFVILKLYQEKVRRLNWLTRCFRYRGLRRDAEVDLSNAFEQLHESVRCA